MCALIFQGRLVISSTDLFLMQLELVAVLLLWLKFVDIEEGAYLYEGYSTCIFLGKRDKLYNFVAPFGMQIEINIKSLHLSIHY